MADKGITYKESYPLKVVTNESGETHYEVDFDSVKTTIYNSDYRLSRNGNICTIIKVYRGDIWNVDEATNYPIYKKEYLNGISEEPKINVDIEFDRGVATAFENHFKLGECNSFEDLENYGNNYFNL